MKVRARKGDNLLGGVLVVLLAIIVFLPYQSQLYERTIGQVTHEKVLKTDSVTDEHDNQDQLIEQELTILVKNGMAQGRKLKLKNTYSLSEIDSERFKEGDKLFVKLDDENADRLTGQLIGSKRDEKLVLLLAAFIILLYVVGTKAGLLALVSLAINSSLLLLVLDYFIQGKTHNLVGVMVLLLPILIIVSLFLVSGWQLKTLAAIIATFVGTLLAFTIGWLVVTSLNHQGLRYEELDFITRSPHVLFISSLLIGCLGAVMDVAMTISSAMFEALEQNTHATLAELKKAGQQVGRDIIGPMSNVLLLSYVSGSLPILLIYLRNQLDLTYTISTVLSLEIARALVGSIGIVLTVPITIYSVLLLLRWREVKK